jgi:glycosyltransferase involved in cell wall biosynthesis
MRPLRVLHVLGAMNQGGVETWLMHVLRHLDRENFQTDFLVHTLLPAAYDDEVIALGSRILRCPHTQSPLLYSTRFLKVIRSNGPFDVLHSHVHHFSGLVLALGRMAGIPVRIAHSHNDTISADSTARLARKIYLRAMERLILTNCTHGFAVSERAALALFGDGWRRDQRLKIFNCGIDLAPFRSPFDRVNVRAEFGFSSRDIIFGHVGRFEPQKNHKFFLEVAACILKHEPRAMFLLVGDGALRPEVEMRAAALGLKHRIVFAGLRSDIPRLMMGAMDVFLLTSVHEGIPLAVMETQAAGLPCVASHALSEEAILNPALVYRLPLSVGADEWARVASETAQHPRFDRDSAVAILDASRFDIRRGIQQMYETYLGSLSRCRLVSLLPANPAGRNCG